MMTQLYNLIVRTGKSFGLLQSMFTLWVPQQEVTGIPGWNIGGTGLV